MSCINGKGSIGNITGKAQIPSCLPVLIKNSDGTYTIGAASGEEFVLPDTNIYNSENDLIATIPSVKDYTAPDGIAKNTEGETVGSIPSGGEGVIPNGTIINGQGSVSGVETIAGGTTQLPNIDIYNLRNVLIASEFTPVTNWRLFISNTPIENTEGTQILVAYSGEVNVLGNILLKEPFGDWVSKPAGVNIEATQVLKTYAWPVSSGIPSSFWPGDDAWVHLNIFSNLPGGRTPRLADFHNLRNEAHNANSFGTYKRFTSSNGGYYDEVTLQYKTVAGVVTTRAAAFPNNYLIDHYTGLGWLMVVQNAATWAAVVSGGLGTDFGGSRNNLGFTNWFSASLGVYNTLRNMGNSGSGNTNYAPVEVSSLYATTSTVAAAPTQFLSINNFSQIGTAVKSSQGGNYLICRKHF